MINPEQPDTSQGIEIRELCGRLGMEADLVTQDNVLGYVIPAAVETFLDGEVRSLHGKPEDPRLEALFGTHEFGKGSFKPALAALREQVHSERSWEGSAESDDQLLLFEHFCARLVAQSTVKGSPNNPHVWQMVDQLAAEAGQSVSYDAVHIQSNPLDMSSIRPTTRLKGSMLVLGNFEEQLDRAPQRVMHYGPSIQGRYYIDAQAAMLRRDVMPFHYMPIARGAFVNAFLMEYMDKKLEQSFNIPRLGQVMMARQLYLGREDGIAAATDEMLRAQKANNAPAEIFDLVVSSGLYNVPRDEMAKGIENAYKLMRSGGALALRHPVPKLNPTGAGAHEVLDMARDAGFDVDGANVHHEMTGADVPTESLAVVLRKPR